MKELSSRILPLVALWLGFGLSPLRAERTYEYQGEARAISRSDSQLGAVVYLEKHRVKLDDQGNLLRAVTRYESPNGELLAELDSDFRESLTVPSHTIVDHRTGNSQGLRRENGRLVLFDREKGKPERTRVLTESDAGSRVLVGCQGLNYYLIGNLHAITPSSRLSLRFLIPGKLDYYDFGLAMTGESPEGIVDFEVTIQNWFLRLFAPKLEVRYDKTLKRIVWYRGISNILNDRGENQSVAIHYTY